MLIAYPPASSRIFCSTENAPQESRAWELDTLGSVEYLSETFWTPCSARRFSALF
jgi:hypothetical protein